MFVPYRITNKYQLRPKWFSVSTLIRVWMTKNAASMTDSSGVGEIREKPLGDTHQRFLPFFFHFTCIKQVLLKYSCPKHNWCEWCYSAGHSGILHWAGPSHETWLDVPQLENTGSKNGWDLESRVSEQSVQCDWMGSRLFQETYIALPTSLLILTTAYKSFELLRAMLPSSIKWDS